MHHVIHVHVFDVLIRIYQIEVLIKAGNYVYI